MADENEQAPDDLEPLRIGLEELRRKIAALRTRMAQNNEELSRTLTEMEQAEYLAALKQEKKRRWKK